MLEGKGVSKSFGGLKALREVDFLVREGEIVGLIGPNGSGKTTLFNVITGFYRPDAGSITFKGEPIHNRPPNAIANRGIGRTFQIVRPFREMTVLQNIAVSALYGGPKLSKLSAGLQEATKWVEFCGLEKKKTATAKELTLAEQKRLEIARALALKPKVLLLDESLAGLNPAETENALALVRRIKDDLGISIFMIEHVMKVVMRVSDRIIVLNEGRKIAEGKPEEIAHDNAVVEAYLGKAYI